MQHLPDKRKMKMSLPEYITELMYCMTVTITSFFELLMQCLENEDCGPDSIIIRFKEEYLVVPGS